MRSPSQRRRRCARGGSPRGALRRRRAQEPKTPRLVRGAGPGVRSAGSQSRIPAQTRGYGRRTDEASRRIERLSQGARAPTTIMRAVVVSPRALTESAVAQPRFAWASGKNLTMPEALLRRSPARQIIRGTRRKGGRALRTCTLGRAGGRGARLARRLSRPSRATPARQTSIARACAPPADRHARRARRYRRGRARARP